MPTFLFDPRLRRADVVTIKGDEARHMTGVLRMKVGEAVRLIDGRGEALIGRLEKISPGEVHCRIEKKAERSGEAQVELTLAIGLSAGFKFDWVVEKGTEIGVRKFVPLMTEKGKVKIREGTSGERKLERWRRVAEAAAKQSDRAVVPDLIEPVAFDVFIGSVKPETTLLFHPDDKADNLKAVLERLPAPVVTLVIGPESGFSRQEIELAQKRGVPSLSLGSRILRTETAGIVLPALVIYHFEIINS